MIVVIFVTLFQYAADIHCILAVAFFLSKGSYAASALYLMSLWWYP
ncbi:TPA: hypothetical protein ACWSRI_004712 [Escherichia coli]